MKNKTHKAIVVIAVALLAAMFVTGTVTGIYAADEKAEAKKLYKEARAALNDDEYKDAAGKAISHRFSIIYTNETMC